MMSDADVDGSHIRTLLMTFFYRQMPRLVAEGHLYVAQPPLYMIVNNKKDRRYVHTEDQMQTILMDTGLAGSELSTPSPPDAARQCGAQLRPSGPTSHGGPGRPAQEPARPGYGHRARAAGFWPAQPLGPRLLALAHSATDPKADPAACCPSS